MRILNTGHPLLDGITRLWLPDLTGSKGRVFPSWGKYGRAANGGTQLGDGTLTSPASWVNTPHGAGVACGSGSRISVGRSQLAYSTLLIAYIYKWDGGSGNETGCLFGASGQRWNIRHNDTRIYTNATIFGDGLTSNVGNPGNGTLNTVALTCAFTSTGAPSLYYNGRLVAASSSYTAAVFSDTTESHFGGLSATNYGLHTILGAFFAGSKVMSAQHIWEWDQCVRQRWQPIFKSPIWIGDGLFHANDDLSASLNLGFGLGSSGDPEPWLRHGVGLGASTALEPYVTQGLALGSSPDVVDKFGLITPGIGLGSQAGRGQLVQKGFALGSQAKPDGQYANAKSRIGLGSKAESDSGDLANSRYRR